MRFDFFRRRVRVRVSGILIRDGALLLIAHRKKDRVYWLLPGGGVKFGESLERALRREFREELGIDVDVHDLVLACDSIEPGGRRHIVNLSFRCTYREGEYALGAERRLHGFGFFGREDIPGKKIYPPMQDAIITILDNKTAGVYLGSLWKD